MSGPYDRADDPDEVTLWAGRLRSWPLPPPAGGDDEIPDETVLSARQAAEDETVVSRPEMPEDETVLSAREAAEDETVLSAREVPEDETVLSAREVPEDETVVSRPEVPEDDTVRSSGEDPADQTVISRGETLDDATIRSSGEGRAHQSVISRGEAPDDATIRSRAASREASETFDADDDEAGDTAPRGRAGARSDVAGVTADEETIRRRPSTGTPIAEVDETVRRAPSVEAAIDEATRARPLPEVDDDTASGSRRRRREAAHASSHPAVDGAVRGARVPEALGRESYGPRREAPARVERVPVLRTATTQDAATIRPRARRGAARVVVLVSIIVVVIVASAIGAAVLLTG